MTNREFLVSTYTFFSQRRPPGQVQLNRIGSPTTNVRIVGLDVSINDLGMFMLKSLVALIPVAIIVGLVALIISFIYFALFV